MEIELYPENPILIVDDEVSILYALELALASEGFTNLRTLKKPTQVMPLLDSEKFDVVLLDIVMPDLSGDKLLDQIRERHPDIPVIMVSGLDDVQTAVACMRRGAFDFITKPADKNQLAASLRRVLEVRNLQRQKDALAKKLLSPELKSPEVFREIITGDAGMVNIFRYCEAIAQGGEPILITGETGTGKELFSKALHQLSKRKGRFSGVNVAGLDDQAFSDTLFGHTRGAFTGAERKRDGFFEKSAHGTIFLDEIGDLEPSSQIKLLRVIEEKEYFPLGSDQARPLTARLISATHQSLERLQAEGRFRLDFFYRIKTHHIHIPPLRERKGDIPLLFGHFLKLAAKEFNKKNPPYPKELLSLLKAYDYPGNVRELRGITFDAVASHPGGTLSLQPFENYLQKIAPKPSLSTRRTEDESLFARFEKIPTLKEASLELVEEALKRSGGNQRIASGMLGITPQALNKRLKSQKD